MSRTLLLSEFPISTLSTFFLLLSSNKNANVRCPCNYIFMHKNRTPICASDQFIHFHQLYVAPSQLENVKSICSQIKLLIRLTAISATLLHLPMHKNKSVIKITLHTKNKKPNWLFPLQISHNFPLVSNCASQVIISPAVRECVARELKREYHILIILRCIRKINTTGQQSCPSLQKYRITTGVGLFT